MECKQKCTRQDGENSTRPRKEKLELETLLEQCEREWQNTAGKLIPEKASAKNVYCRKIKISFAIFHVRCTEIGTEIIEKRIYKKRL